VLGLCKRLVRCILLIWLTYLDVNSHRTCEPDQYGARKVRS
jgi:hypothetical protein